MKKFALTVTLLGLWTIKVVHAAEFFCPSGDVTCLIAAINEANAVDGEHTINLELGSYTLQTIDNGSGTGANGLPVITSSIRIQGSTDDIPTIIELDPDAPRFRIFQVAVGGELTLDGVTIKRGSSSVGAIANRGIVSLQDSIVTDSSFDAAVFNIGTLLVLRSIISHNSGSISGGGIHNGTDGTALIENSTIAHNTSFAGAGILNRGSLVVKNSAIIFNSSDGVQPGGGILNNGTAEIINSTIAQNPGGILGGGGGVFNGGQVSIINSTIRENTVPARFGSAGQGGGISNHSIGTLEIQNTIVAGNSVSAGRTEPIGPDCLGTITSLGNNLIGDPSDCGINLQATDLTGDPGLDSLVEEDLPGRAFYPVLAGSSVIDRGNPNACLQSDQLGLLRIGICDIGAVEFRGPMLVSVDVRPRSDANRINPNSIKNINVAIFSVNGFNATTIDSSTVRFGATGTEAVPINVALRDVDGDGDRDMVVRFEIQDTGIKEAPG
jgi:hypothetical protein